MKRLTYNNFIKSMRIIEKKGYTKEEAEAIVRRIFDEHANGPFTIEHWLDLVLPKSEWKASYK